MINAEQTICVRIMCKNCNEDFTKDETPIENFRDRILILSNYIRGVVYSNKLKRSDDKTYLYERVHCFNCKNTIGKLIRSSINAKQTVINHIKLKLQNVIILLFSEEYDGKTDEFNGIKENTHSINDHSKEEMLESLQNKFKRFNMKMKETARIIENVCSEYKNELELIEYYKCVLTLLYDKYIRSPQNIEKTDNQGHIEETKNISDPKLSKGTKAIDNNLTLNDNNITQDKIVIKKTKRKDSYQKKIKKFKIQK